MAKYLTSKQFQGLVQAVNDSFRKLEPFRKVHTEIVALFAGDKYGGGGSKKIYVNLLALAQGIFLRQLAVRAPTARIISDVPELRPLAANLSLACKEVAEETDMGEVLREAVTDSFFAPMAIIKVGLTVSGDEVIGDETVPVTEPIISRISFDNFVRDMSKDNADFPAFTGDKYTVTIRDLHKYFPETEGWDLSARPGSTAHDGTPALENDTASISHDEGGLAREGDELDRKIDLIDVFIPDTNMLITYLPSHAERPVREALFDGPDKGPYHQLWYTPVPDNAMPLAPFSVSVNIADLANSLYRRMAAQAKNQKEVAGFSDEESALLFQEAMNGDAIKWNGQKPETIKVGGIDQANMAMFVATKDIFSWLSGNLDLLGGLSPMSDTAKQDQMLTESASVQVRDMQEAVVSFARGIFAALAWYEWTDPIRERDLYKKLPGIDETIHVDWTPETRQGDFLLLNFDIIPGSMREDDPVARMARFKGVFRDFILPLLPMMEQQRIALDVRKLVKYLGDGTDLPELEDMIRELEGEQEERRAVGNPTPQVQGTPREYVHTSRPGASRAGKDQTMVSTLLGAKQQGAETDQLTRPVS